MSLFFTKEELVIQKWHAEINTFQNVINVDKEKKLNNQLCYMFYSNPVWLPLLLTITIKLENYKLLKVNGLLTLLPELKIDTREQLVEKFSKCTSSKEVLNLYKKVVGLVKEERKPSFEVFQNLFQRNMILRL